MSVAYILPDFDENALSGGLYVIFQHINGLVARGHTVHAYNNAGISPRYLRLDVPVRLMQDLGAHPAGHQIIVGTHWRTYYQLERLAGTALDGVAWCLLVQSDDPSFVHGEEREYASRSLTGELLGRYPVRKMAVSRYLQDLLLAAYGQESAYIPNGIHVKEVAPLLPRAPEGVVRIASRYDPSSYRGWDTAAAVLGRLAGEYPRAEIHLFEMKAKKAAPLPHRFHKGLCGERLLALYKSCDIYLSASRHEGFCYPILEAMSQGACVVTTDAGGNREFCIDGETALVSKPDDTEALFRNAARALGDAGLRGRLGDAGRKMACGYTWGRSVDRLEEFFLESLARLPKPAPHTKTATPEKDLDYAIIVASRDPLSSYESSVALWDAVRRYAERSRRVDVLCWAGNHTVKSCRARAALYGPNETHIRYRFAALPGKRPRIVMRFIAMLCFVLYNTLAFVQYLRLKSAGNSRVELVRMARGD